MRVRSSAINKAEVMRIENTGYRSMDWTAEIVRRPTLDRHLLSDPSKAKKFEELDWMARLMYLSSIF
jgi:hypothetical protein